MEITKHQPGMFSWADLAAADRGAAVDFYAGLFGLGSADNSMGGSGVHSTLDRDGRRVCAVYDIPPQMTPLIGEQTSWKTYFTVESADAAAARTKDLGGAVLMGPMDLSEEGRMVLGQDPMGAIFFLWEPRNHTGAELFAEPGALAWTELYTSDVARATEFYTGLFGWTAHPADVGGGMGEYTEFRLDGQSSAGMMAIREEWGEMPSIWSIYFAVADLDESRERARELGATEITPPMEVEEVGRFIQLQDPQGAYVSLIQPTRP